jgi:hypothetical protein
MNDRGRAKEAFLATIRLLGNSGVQAHDGGHLEERMLRHMLSDSSAHFGLWIVGIGLVQLALTALPIGRLNLDIYKCYTIKMRFLLTWPIADEI